MKLTEVKIGEVVFSKAMILDVDASLASIPDQFVRLQSKTYPYTFTFVVSTTLFYTKPPIAFLSIRVNKNGAIVYQSGSIRLPFEPSATEPKDRYAIAIRLENVTFPKPGKYNVELLLNARVRHSEPLYLDEQ